MMRPEDYEGVDVMALPEYQRRHGKEQAAHHTRIVTADSAERKVNATARMVQVDALTSETRALVAEFGWPAVKKRLGMSPRAMRISIEQARRVWYVAQAEADRAAALDSIELEL